MVTPGDLNGSGGFLVKVQVYTVRKGVKASQQVEMENRKSPVFVQDWKLHHDEKGEDIGSHGHWQEILQGRARSPHVEKIMEEQKNTVNGNQAQNKRCSE